MYKNLIYKLILWTSFPLLFLNAMSLHAQNGDSITHKLNLLKEHFDSNRVEALFKTTKTLDQLISDKQRAVYGAVQYYYGEYWYELGDYEKSLTYLKNGIRLLQKDTAHAKILAEAYQVAGFCSYELNDLDAAYEYYNKTISLANKIYGATHENTLDIYFNLGCLFQVKRDLLQSDQYFFKSINILTDTYGEVNPYLADYYEEIGLNYSWKGDYNAAINYLSKAIELRKEFKDDTERFQFAYDYLGRSYVSLENYEKAIGYFTKALQSIKQDSEFSEEKDKAMLHFRIGEAWLYLKKYEKAITHFEQAKKINPENEYFEAEQYRLIGEARSKEGRGIEAWNYFENALKEFKKNASAKEGNLIWTYRSMVAHLILEKQYQKALAYIDLALELVVVRYKDSPVEFFELYKNKAKCYLYLGEIEQARQFYKKANEVNGGTIEKEDANLLQLRNRLHLNIECADMDLQAFQTNPNKHFLVKADSILSQSIELIFYITKNYQERSTKSSFIEQFYAVFRKAIDIKYQLYKVTKDKKYLEAAFSLSEKSKNLTLLETLKDIKSYELSEMPTSLSYKKQRLKTNITYLENRRFEEQQLARINTKLVGKLNQTIFDLKQEYETLLKQIEKDYPEFYELKYTASTISVDKVQNNLLDKNQSFIEYFISDTCIYAFVLNKNDFNTYILPKGTTLIKDIKAFRSSIYNYQTLAQFQESQTASIDSLTTVYRELGHQLYNDLVRPFQNVLKQSISIVTDGILGYIPFDALLKEAARNDQPFRSYHYMMNAHIISYAHSFNWLNSLTETVRTTDFKTDFIGIAPTFEAMPGSAKLLASREELTPLKHNIEEVDKIKAIIGGQSIVGSAATRKAFMKLAASGKIIHLATHGKANDKQGDYSFLAFASPQDSLDKQFLYTKNLFNLKIPVELMVLSACETGLGEIKRGEGILGIGKGFSYAGAKSLLTTLWRINDNSTAKLMPIFYKNLKAGLPKDEALWKAKKTFIQNHRHAGHPIFWSAYVLYGDTRQIEFQQIRPASLFFGSAATVLFLLFGWRFWRTAS